MEINYSKDLKIKNVAFLPSGTGAKFLEVIAGEDGEFVAKQWKRKIPTNHEGLIFIKF